MNFITHMYELIIVGIFLAWGFLSYLIARLIEKMVEKRK